MQCNPPLCGAGFPGLGQYHCCNQSLPQYSVYPEIIGEGEVVSVVFPDGSIQLYFIPINKRFPPACHPHSNYHPYFNNGTGAYYVRSISNPIPSSMFNQQCQQIYSGRFPRPCYNSDWNMNIPPPGFQLKFHNDCWTSTTDLHYFFPCLRQCDWFPATQLKGCASVQVDIPMKATTFCNQEVSCAKPCICSISDDESWSGTENVECHCDKVGKPRRSRSCVTEKQHGSKTRLKIRKSKRRLKSKKSKVVCECKEQSTTDKSITTYADQASCAAESERNTQTCRSCTTATSVRGGSSIANRSHVKTELWFPKIKSSPKEDAMQSKSSEKIIGVYETTCSSATCCCSTDTDTRDA
ncbi:uncharacterized protein LOC135079304 [Ostrinia nubilalis]|uniref:uncharacterized protein LOC135079304 n=1 Tax=Ostrinia nubilalis TaxID=29057 RepID=UPI0030823915